MKHCKSTKVINLEYAVIRKVEAIINADDEDLCSRNCPNLIRDCSGIVSYHCKEFNKYMLHERGWEYEDNHVVCRCDACKNKEVKDNVEKGM